MISTMISDKTGIIIIIIITIKTMILKKCKYTERPEAFFAILYLTF